MFLGANGLGFLVIHFPAFRYTFFVWNPSTALRVTNKKEFLCNQG